MALFKIFKGNDIRKLNDPSVDGYMPPIDGYAYYNTNNQQLYIDADYDSNNTITRKPVNAFYAYSAGYDGLQTPQRIDSTYIKDISFSNDALIIMKGNGTTATVNLNIPYALSTTAGGTAVNAAIANQLSHTLTFGANSEFSFDGSADVNVPVYTGSASWS